MKEFGVIPEAWGPLAEGNHGIFTHPVLIEIGKKAQQNSRADSP